jgi:hypothetical protein
MTKHQVELKVSGTLNISASDSLKLRVWFIPPLFNKNPFRDLVDSCNVEMDKKELILCLKLLGLNSKTISSIKTKISKSSLRKEIELEIIDVSLHALKKCGLYKRRIRYEKIPVGLSPSKRFDQILIHDPNCPNVNHTSAFPKYTIRIWKEIIHALEDKKTNNWKSARMRLMEVPPNIQRQFIKESSKALIRIVNPDIKTMKSFGLPFKVANQAYLLIGILYERWTFQSLRSWIKGVYGIENKGAYSQCLVLLFDITRGTPPAVRLYNFTDFWKNKSELNFYIEEYINNSPCQ